MSSLFSSAAPGLAPGLVTEDKSAELAGAYESELTEAEVCGM